MCKHQCLLVLEGEPTKVTLPGPVTAGQWYSLTKLATGHQCGGSCAPSGSWSGQHPFHTRGKRNDLNVWGVRGADIASTDREVSKTPNQPPTEQLPRESYISNEYCTELHSARVCTVQHGATNITQTAKVVNPPKRKSEILMHFKRVYSLWHGCLWFTLS